MVCDHVIVFPIRHHGDPTHGDSRYAQSASVGVRARGAVAMWS